VELSQKHETCWIDQICIPQKDDKIRETLAAIPTIFKTLHVITLFPGPICSCLRTAYDKYQLTLKSANAADEPAQDGTLALALKELEAAVKGISCINSNGACSWVKRVWPSQELRHCSSIQLVWASSQLITCNKVLQR